MIQELAILHNLLIDVTKINANREIQYWSARLDNPMPQAKSKIQSGSKPNIGLATEIKLTL